MYLFVYKTTHVNGKYYIGRHQTENLDDGYMGSGKWVKSIKDQTTLSREIISEANSIEELCALEEYYINLHWEDPMCMNMIKGSNGWTSEDISYLSKKFNSDKVKNGTHNFLTRPDGTNVAIDRVRKGTHNWQTRPDGTNSNTDKVKNGTHHFLTRSDGTNVAIDRINNGTHNFLTRPNGTNLQTDRVNNGIHQFLTRPDGTNVAIDRVNNGTHNFLEYKGSVACYNKFGEYKRISKESYSSQTGPKKDWEWVHMNSREGKLRKVIKTE